MMHARPQAVRTALTAFALSALLCATVGCGAKENGRVAVSGNVTFDGQPLASGQVVFEPRGVGRMAIAQIADGRYAIAAERGPTAGSYIVRITAARPTGEMASAGAMGAGELREVQAQFLPAKYNDASELSIDVDATAPVVRDFDLRSQ